MRDHAGPGVPDKDQRVRDGRLLDQKRELQSNVLGRGSERRGLRVVIAGTVLGVAS